MRKSTPAHPILPICLLLEGKPCLVVGGGVIATRKAGQLLEAAADVTVVSPEVSDEMQALVQAQKVQLIPRAFGPTDVLQKCLVFAATDNEAVNQQVLESCRQSGILCSAADSNWPHGDFVMPATCRKNGVVVAVSTGGRSCTQARSVKDQIAALLAALPTEE